jgi:hypothetical protein
MQKIVFIFFIMTIYSCSKEQYVETIIQPEGCDSIKFTFDKHIKPIFNSNCNFDECHASGGAGSYDFTDYDVVKNRVEAGTVDYRLDLPYDDPQHMPYKMKISSCDYYAIKTWIKQGYAEK